MGETTGIAWCDHTFNAWEGCEKVSAGCKNCYAETRNVRFHGGEHWGHDAPRLMRSESYWREPLKWDAAARKAGVRRRVFCASLSDVFEDRNDLVAPRERLFTLIDRCTALDWLLLTKRPENMRRLAAPHWGSGKTWPHHVWAGATTEDPDRLAERAPLLQDVPAAVRFLSAEPLLGSIAGTESGLSKWFQPPCDCCDLESSIQWVICGGESGRTRADARPFDLQWAREIVRDCAAAGVACFVKQLGTNPRDSALLDLRPGEVERVWLNDGHGADTSEWPVELRVQQFPRSAA